jgi:hypothetical protein
VAIKSFIFFSSQTRVTTLVISILFNKYNAAAYVAAFSENYKDNDDYSMMMMTMLIIMVFFIFSVQQCHTNVQSVQRDMKHLKSLSAYYYRYLLSRLIAYIRRLKLFYRRQCKCRFVEKDTRA